MAITVHSTCMFINPIAYTNSLNSIGKLEFQMNLFYLLCQNKNNLKELTNLIMSFASIIACFDEYSS